MDIFLLYAVCFGVGLLFTMVTAVFGEMFSHDVHVGGSHMPGTSFLSPMTLAVFVTAFGGLGLIFHRIEATQSPWVSASLALFGALAIAALVVSILRTIFRHTQSSSESKVDGLAGLRATILTPIPANGVGEIAYVDSGTRYTAPAREETGRPVATGQTVKITRVVASQFYVTGPDESSPSI